MEYDNITKLSRAAAEKAAGKPRAKDIAAKSRKTSQKNDEEVDKRE